MRIRFFAVVFADPLFTFLASRRIFLAYAAGKIRVADSQANKDPQYSTAYCPCVMVQGKLGLQIVESLLKRAALLWCLREGKS